MQERVSGATRKRLFLYSAHDSSLLALQTRLGIVCPAPSFVAHMVFELHRLPSGQHEVRTFFNPDPSRYQMHQLIPRMLTFEPEFW